AHGARARRGAASRVDRLGCIQVAIMASKGGMLLLGLVTQGAQLLGHGPSCPATCECRVAGAVAGTVVRMLEGAARKGRQRKGAAARAPGRPVGRAAELVPKSERSDGARARTV